MQVTEYFWQYQDDRVLQYGGRNGSGHGNLDRFERRSYSTRVGVLQR